MTEHRKPVAWVGSSRKDFKEFPSALQDEIGYALYLAQLGGKSERAKPLKGFSGAGVLEIFEDHKGNTFRVVYTVRFAKAVYVLHAFQKNQNMEFLHRNKRLI